MPPARPARRFGRAALPARPGCRARLGDPSRAAESSGSSGRSTPASSSACSLASTSGGRCSPTRLHGLAQDGSVPQPAASSLTLFVAPRTNRIYYDEQIYQSVGQNLADLRLAQVCNDGSVEYGRLQCGSGEYNKQPYALSPPAEPGLSLRSVFMPATAFVVNAAAMGADGLLPCICSSCCCSQTATRRSSRRFSLALTPRANRVVGDRRCRAFRVAGVRGGAFVRGALRPFAGHGGDRRCGRRHRVCGAISSRVVPDPARSSGCCCGRARARSSRVRDCWWAGVAVPGARGRPHGPHVRRQERGWGTTQARLSLEYVADNLRVNGLFYLATSGFPPLFTLLAILGLSRRPFRKRARWPWRCTSCCSSGSISLFYAGSYNYGADVRYSLLRFRRSPSLAGWGRRGSSRAQGGHGSRPRRALMTDALMLPVPLVSRPSFARPPRKRGPHGRTCVSRSRSR